MKVTKAKDVKFALPNKAGTLQAALKPLAEAGINVVGLCGWIEGRKSMVRLLVSDPAKAARLLKKQGLAVETNPVLVIECPDKPGQGASFMSALAEAGVNMLKIYGTATGGAATAVLSADPMAKAFKVLKAL